MAGKAQNREEWLKALAERLNTLVFDGAMPAYRVACGWPSRGGTAQAKRVIGQCWDADCSADKTHEILISPNLDDPMKVAGVLAHEMIHAIVGIPAGHKKPFRDLAIKIGLVGKMTATTEGPDFIAAVEPVLKEIGAYPHAALTPGTQLKKQSTRLIKAECPECGYNVRVTRKWLDEVGAPLCPNDGPMEIAS